MSIGKFSLANATLSHLSYDPASGVPTTANYVGSGEIGRIMCSDPPLVKRMSAITSISLHL